ncbi:MAG: hypothetical protein WBX25_12135 [Rhodomicrobium sp.]
MKSLSLPSKLSIAWLARTGFFAGLVFVSFPAVAAPLDKSACEKLVQNFQNMKALDVDKMMANGPEWAISHLSPVDLNLVRQYIDLDEQIRFRCSDPASLVHLKHLDEDDEESGTKAQAAKADRSGPEQDRRKNKAVGTTAKQKLQKQRKNAKLPEKITPSGSR